MSYEQFTVGARIVHIAHGGGTIIDRSGYTVVVELDDIPGKDHRFNLALGTVRLEGAPAPPATAVAPEDAAQQRRDIFAPPAPAAKAPAPTPVPETPVSPPPAAGHPAADTLLRDMDRAIAARGRGAIRHLAKALGIHDASVHGWRASGGIPEPRRAGVRAWIEADHPEHKPTASKRKEVSAVEAVGKVLKATVKAAAKAAKAAPPPRAKAKAKVPAAAIPLDVARRVLEGLGLRSTEVWVVEGDVMRRAQAVLLD